MLFLLAATAFLIPERADAADTRRVETLKELEQALAQSGEAVILLKKDIMVSRMLRVKGKKTIDGNSRYQIRRKTKPVYKGTLLWMQGERLRLEGVTLNGSGRSSSVSGDINGRLLETVSGMVLLEKGARLCANYNLTSFTDGGGGITIHSGGKVVMREGSVIYDNLSITGGSGVRVEKGGSFVMEGGTIRDNVVTGQKTGSDFDGRGGGIHNRGEVWIQGGAITGNIARGYRSGENAGGFGGAVYNQNRLRITGGIIRNNQASFAGGAVYTNEESQVSLEGGEIYENRAEDQRGGGIYISASSEVRVSGGKIWNNTARHGTQIFLSSTSSGILTVSGGKISGAGTAVWNNGASIKVTGGEIRGSECGLRNLGVSQIRGGNISGGEKGIFHDEGKLFLSGNIQVNRIQITEEQHVTVDLKLWIRGGCELVPERYQEGKLLVRITSGEQEREVQKNFSLKKRKRFILEARSGGLYIGREKYVIKFDANGGVGEMREQKVYVDETVPLDPCTYKRSGYGFVGWSAQLIPKVTEPGMIKWKDKGSVKNLAEDGESILLYALWVKAPMFSRGEAELVFYEEEQVDQEIMHYGIRAEDELEGDLTGKIRVEKIILPDFRELKGADRLPTDSDHLGKGSIVLSTANSFGVSSQWIQRYEVISNAAPELEVSDRYYFVSEIQNSQKEEILQDFRRSIRFRDDIETQEQLEHGLEISWEKPDFDRAGSYRVHVRIRDQFGHRFYMKPGEQRRYGRGKLSAKEFAVHVVDRENDITIEEEGYVRFISRECLDSLSPDSVWKTEKLRRLLEDSLNKGQEQYEEVWVITGEDKKRIKSFIKTQENPFSRESNKKFIEMFSRLRKK